jgi:hypothetical protein
MTGGGEAFASATTTRSSHKDTNMQVEKPDCFVAALLAMTGGGEGLRLPLPLQQESGCKDTNMQVENQIASLLRFSQ